MVILIEPDPIECAAAHCDQTLTSLAIRTSLVLSAIMDYGFKNAADKADMEWTLWASATRTNFLWLATLAVALVDQHERRFCTDGLYQCRDIIDFAITTAARIKPGNYTLWPEPTGYNTGKPVQSHRKAYCADKHSYATWTLPGRRPIWFSEVYDEVAHSLALIQKKQ